MARTLQTPSINRIIPVDPSREFHVEFQYNDNQLQKSRAVITDTDTYSVVYDEPQLGMSKRHTIPANILTAGKRYVVQIQVFDEEGNSSMLSEQMPFYCYTSPTFYISNIENDTIIKNASVMPLVEYNQPEGEEMANFQIQLYDQSMVLVDSSPMFYDYPLTNGYTFYSLTNNGIYYVKATGETTHGIPLETDTIQITIVYATIPANAVFTAENVYNNGYVNIVSNINDVGYQDKNCVIEDGILTIENGYLLYNEGFEVPDNGYYRLGIQVLPEGTFFIGGDDKFTVGLREIDVNYYFWLESGDYHLFKPIDYVSVYGTYSKDGVNTVLYDLRYNGILYLEIIEKGGVYDMRITYK